jgi:hypothetical protein
MDAAGKYRVLDFSALDADAEPVRVRSVENDVVDGSLIQTFDPGQYAPVELVPNLSAGTAGSAIPVAGSGPRPAARYRGGSVLPAEAPPIVNATPLPPRRTSAHAPRARASRGRPVRRRGSRRGTTATRAGPDDGSGDPEPGPSFGHLTATNGGATPAQNKGGGGWDRR